MSSASQTVTTSQNIYGSEIAALQAKNKRLKHELSLFREAENQTIQFTNQLKRFTNQLNTAADVSTQLSSITAHN